VARATRRAAARRAAAIGGRMVPEPRLFKRLFCQVFFGNPCRWSLDNRPMPLLPEIPGPIAASSRWSGTSLSGSVGGYAQSGAGACLDRRADAVDGPRVGGTAANAGGGDAVTGGGRRECRSCGRFSDPSDLLAKARIEGVALESEELRAIIALAEEITGWTELMRTPPREYAGPAA